MTPTRELALQIFRECKKFCKPLNLRVVCVYGGTGISEQVSGDLQLATNGVQTLCSNIFFSVILETFHPPSPTLQHYSTHATLNWAPVVTKTTS